MKLYFSINEYLSNGITDGKLNRADCDFIVAQLKEYEDAQQKKQEKEFMSYVHDKTKALVRRYAAGVGANKTKIDAPIEAHGLLAELNNPQNDFNDYDRKYILKIVQESGVLPRFGIGCGEASIPENNVNSTCPTAVNEPVAEEESLSTDSKKRKYNTKQLEILKEMAKVLMLSASGSGLTVTVQKAIELLMSARANGLEDTAEFRMLEEFVKQTE